MMSLAKTSQLHVSIVRLSKYIRNTFVSVISSYLLGGICPPPPESQIPPEKHPKYKKKH